MIYIIDHQDSFTWNVVHQFAEFEKVYCSDYFNLNLKLLKKSDVIVFSPGPGSPKDYPETSKIYKLFKMYDETVERSLTLVENYKLHDYIKLVWLYINEVNKFFNDSKPWELSESNPKLFSDILGLTSDSIKKIAFLIICFYILQDKHFCMLELILAPQ
mgnify:CR=1 FL=1